MAKTMEEMVAQSKRWGMVKMGLIMAASIHEAGSYKPVVKEKVVIDYSRVVDSKGRLKNT